MEKDAHETIIVDLRKPVDLRGRLAQRLGTIRRVAFSLDSRRIVMVELETEWQTLKLSGDLVEFDAEVGCWYMKRGLRLGHSEPTADATAAFTARGG